MCQAEVAALKEKLRDVRANADSLYTEFLLTKTANRVGCKKEELVGTKVVCPQEKLGMVIGKKGSNVRQLQATASVTVNVLKEGDVRIMGAPEALDTATANLQKVIDTKEETFSPPNGVIAFLTSRHIKMLKEISERHPNVRLSVQRQSETISLRGIPADLDRLKEDLLGLDLMVKVLELPDSEAAYVVGKQGATVEGLVSTYQTAIDVVRQENGSSTVTLTGPAHQVEMATAEVEKLAAEVRETMHSIDIDPIAKAALMESKGAGIQELNKSMNENKQAGFVNANFDENKLVLRGRAMHLPDAIAIAMTEIRRVESLKVTLEVDPIIIPAIIGKGGETIKAIKDGRPVVVEVEKSGKILVCGCDKSQVDVVVQAVQDAIAGNAVRRLKVEASLYKRIAGELVRSKAKTINGLCKLSLDDNLCDVVLRGEPEKISEAATIVLDFIKTNYIEEVLVAAKDMQTLLRGGKSSKIMDLATEFEVRMNAERDKGVVIVRGEQDKVHAAVKALNQFLFGGDGLSVVKIPLNEQLLGIVIGKAGKTKDELLKKFPGVSLAVDSAECIITLRGPESAAEECRIEVSKLIASAQISESLELSQKTYQHLTKCKPRDIVRDIPVQLNITESSLTVRGYRTDVADALSLLKEAIHGRYEARLVLSSPQFSQIASACRRGLSPLQRVMDSSGATIALDSSDDSLVFRGNKAQVRSAKQELMAFLDFLFGPSFSRMELSGPLRLYMGKMSTLTEVSAVSGASVHFDRDTGYLLLFSVKAENVDKARSMLYERIAEASKLFSELSLEPSEDWIVSSIIGKKGAQISKLRKATKCEIDVDSSTRTILIRSKDAELVAAARMTLEDFVNKLRRENALIEIPEVDLPAFIGRSGAKITEFSDKYDVEAKVQKTSPPSIRFHGDELAVAAAKAAVLEWIKTREAAQKEAAAVETLKVRRDKVVVVIGAKGSTIRLLESEFGCKVDVDRETFVVSIRGGNAEKRAATIAKIHSLLSAEPQDAADPEVGSLELDQDLPQEREVDDTKTKAMEPKEENLKSDRTRTPASIPAKEAPKPSDFPVLVGPSKKGMNDSKDEAREEGTSATTCSTVLSGDSPTWSSVVLCQPACQRQGALQAPQDDHEDWKENAVNGPSNQKAFDPSSPIAVAVNDP